MAAVGGPIEPAMRRGGLLSLLVAVGLVAVTIGGTALWLWLTAPPPPKPEPVVVLIPPDQQQPPAAESGAPPAEAAGSFDITGAGPSENLTEASPAGPLPIKTKDGSAPYKAYARPFDDKDKRPRIAIIVGGLGMSATETDTAIRSLPGEVSLSFMPYSKRLPEWVGLARAGGHEALLDLPMEPPDVLHNDPGPNALRTALDTPTNIQRLEWMMAQAQGTGFVGMLAYMGGRFEEGRQDIEPVLQDLNKRGLIYVDNRVTLQSVAPILAAAMKMPFAVATRQIDVDPARASIDRKLAELEDVARRNGASVGIAQVSVGVLDRLAAWAPGLNARGLTLAPITAVASPEPAKPEPPPTIAPPPPPPPPPTKEGGKEAAGEGAKPKKE